jgi:hypothetical protein
MILQLKLNDFILGRGLWKINNSLLYEMDYDEIVKKTIKKTKEQYAASVYDKSTLSEIDDLVIHFTINDQLFLENKKLENCFVEDIMKLENELHTTENFDLIEKKNLI